MLDCNLCKDCRNNPAVHEVNCGHYISDPIAEECDECKREAEDEKVRLILRVLVLTAFFRTRSSSSVAVESPKCQMYRGNYILAYYAIGGLLTADWFAKPVASTAMVSGSARRAITKHYDDVCTVAASPTTTTT